MAARLIVLKGFPWSIPVLAVVIMAAAVFFARSEGGLAVVADDFEIDANITSATDADYARAAYYAGLDPSASITADDWATDAPVPPADGTNDGLADCQDPAAGVNAGQEPAFLLCNSDRDDVADCYQSKVVVNPNADGTPVLICDGNSGGSLQVEEDIVSSFSGCSDQKTNDNRWCVKQDPPLNNPAKSDETHGYVILSRQVVCDQDGPTWSAGDVHTVVLGGYERLGNEGTVFAGFHFYQVPPLEVEFGVNSTLNFVDPTDSTIHYRTEGDFLVLLNQTGQTATMQRSVAVDDDLDPNTVPVFPAPSDVQALVGNCGSTAVINGVNSVLAPPWQGEFCDPSADPTGDDTNELVGTPNNQCKTVANSGPNDCSGPDRRNPQNTDPACPNGGTMVPDSDFVEWVLDLDAEGLDVDPCAVSGILMTSRSSDEFTADLKDVANKAVPPACEIGVDKGGDTLSKIGDEVNYTIVISNPGEVALYAQDISDTLLGDIVSNGVDLGNSLVTSNNCLDPAKNPLQPGDSCTITATRTVEAGDPDPLPNTVTVVYDSKEALDGIEKTDDDPHEVNLFQPAIAVDKTGDELSKVGDDVDYTITLSNNSSADTPDMICTAEDTLLGTVFSGVLPPGDTVINLTRTVLEGDPDPLENTVTLTCSPDGFPNVYTESDSHSVNLFQPAIAVDKTGDTLSKVGDDVDYTITLSNNSSADTPDMVCTAEDTLLGIVFGPDAVLPLGDTVINTSRTVQADDPDPLENTVTLTCSPDGFPNVYTESDSHSVNLFQPAIAVDKTGDTLSKVGDDVDYTITLSNNSSADTPDMVCTAEDTLLGTVFSGVLPPGDTVINTSRTVQEGDPDPLENTVTLTCSPDGFPNVYTESDSHSVNLFQPAIAVDKTGDTLSKVGDDVDYTITLSNNSSDDTPDMICTAEDTLLGTVFSGVLPPGDTVINTSRTVQEGDPDPLENTVTLTCSPDGFPNVYTESDSHSVNLFQPAIAVDKTGDTLSKVGDDVDYTITLSNNSSADTPDMVCTAEDTLLGTVFSGVLPPGDTVINTSRTVQADDPDPLENTVTLTCSPDGFPNVYTESDSHSVNLFQPAIAVDKTGDELSKVGDDVDYTITLSNNSSADTPAMNCTATDSLLGEVFSGVLPLGDTVINTSRTVLEGDPDPLVNTVTLTCSPDGFPNVYTESDSHSVNLFQPAIAVDKTGDTLSKVGDDVDYTITLSNNSSADTPDMVCTAEDTLLGTVFGPDAVLPPGDTVINTSRTVQEGDPDPLENTVTLTCSPDGFPNVYTTSDSHTVNLFQPDYSLVCAAKVDGVDVTGGDVFPGDVVTFEFTFDDLSSPDTPAMSLVSHTFTIGGVPATIAPPDPLADATATADHTVAGTDPSPLAASLDTTYSPVGFPNLYSRSASCEVNIVYGCALSPGYWGGGEGVQKWDQPGLDPIAIAAGFYTGTLFPWVDPSLADPTPGDGFTYLDIFNIPAKGDVTRQLSFKYVAAALNMALGDVDPEVGVPPYLPGLLTDIETYLAANPVGSNPRGAAKAEGKDLFNAINDYFTTVGEEHCPNTGDVPEYTP